MLTQVLPFPGKTGAVRQVRTADEAIARIALERSIREVTLKVRESAIEVGYLRRAREIAAGIREQLANLRAAGANAYARDRTGLYDLLRAQSQEAQTVFDADLLMELEQTEVARLNSLLGRDTDTPVGPIDLRAGRPLSEDVAAITAFAESESREVLLAREESTRARAEENAAAIEARPEFMVGVGYMQESALDEMDASGRWEFQLGMTLPVFWREELLPSRRGQLRPGPIGSHGARSGQRGARRGPRGLLPPAQRGAPRPAVSRHPAAPGVRVAAARRDLASFRRRELRRPRRRGDPLVHLPGRAGPGRGGPREVPRAPRGPRGASAHGAAGGRRTRCRRAARRCRVGRRPGPAGERSRGSRAGRRRRACSPPARRAPSRWPPPPTATPRSPTRSSPKSRSAISNCSR